MINRREFFKYMGLSAMLASGFLSKPLKAATKPRIIIVGGGFSGATCAKYLKLWGGSSIDVTIIEQNSNYISPILSNLVLNSQKTLSDLTFSYSFLQNNYQVNIINKKVENLDSQNKTLTLDDGSTISYDKLILAAGIDFITPNNYDFTKIPHAWIAGEQTTILKNQIDSINDSETFLLSIPKAPYRCPPGPYERACVVADYLKNKKGLQNVNIVVLDENDDIIVEKDTFLEAFNNYQIEYISSAKVSFVDDVAMEVTYTKDGSSYTRSAKVLNIIPNQKAAKIVVDNLLTDSSGFAPVNLLNYESTLKKDIPIIGDSHKSSQPKAGHIANVEAKICADAILRELSGLDPFSSPKTNSACYSPVSSTQASWLTAVYQYEPTQNDMVLVSSSFASGSPSEANYQNMFNWSGNLFADTFK